MRTETEMLNLILGFAEKNEHIRVVYMNGSRANPNIKSDQYQDYDIVYTVSDITPFLAERQWLSRFGDIAMVQEPDLNDGNKKSDLSKLSSYGFLMLFKDGTRIDLRLQTLEETLSLYGKDSLTVPLMDKDGILPSIPGPSEKSYIVKEPELFEYLGCCNNFFWCLNNVAKGIVRDQLPYAMRMFNDVIRSELDKMIEWYIGIDTGFSVNTGMWGKYYKTYLPQEFYEMYESTYSDNKYNSLWEAVFAACRLFRKMAVFVGGYFGYPYNTKDDENIMGYLEKMRYEESPFNIEKDL